jgi:hypothetical protein
VVPARQTITKTLAYSPGTGRDSRLDWLRGYCLFMMIVDHVGTVSGQVVGSSWLYALTGGTIYYASAAEAFYLISGVTLGLIAARESAQDATRRVLTRAFHLYRTSLLLSFFFGMVAFVTGLAYFGRWSFDHTSPFGFVFRTLTLRSETGGAGILVLYVLFMLVTPPAVWLFRLRLTWVVLGLSVIVYAFSQVFPDVNGRLPFAVYFHVLPWQILFFGGLALGFHRSSLITFFAARPGLRRFLEIATIVVALVFLLVHVTDYAVWSELAVLIQPTELLPPVRLVLAMISMLAAYMLCSWLWQPLHAALGWLLEPLGRASLWSFTMHFFVILLIWNLAWFRESGGLWLWFWQALAVLAVWASLRLRDVLIRFQTSLRLKSTGRQVSTASRTP